MHIFDIVCYLVGIGLIIASVVVDEKFSDDDMGRKLYLSVMLAVAGMFTVWLPAFR